MPRTGATFMQYLRSLQHAQEKVHALMGTEERVSHIDVSPVFAFESFESDPPLDVATKRALFSPGLKTACDMHNKRTGPFALATEPPVPATPAGGARRSNGASLRCRRRFAWHRGGVAARNLRLRMLGFLAAHTRAHAARAFVQVSAL